MIKRYKQSIIYLIFLKSSLYADTIDCLSSPIEEEQGCSIASILKEKPSPPFKIREEKRIVKKPLEITTMELQITESMKSIEVTHENQQIVIKRNSQNAQYTCPPFCIKPMNIKGVTTVGELEVLDFIKELKGEEAKLFIDIRKSKKYKDSTIPGAINIPYTMLTNKSKYQKDVLKLLGGKKVGNRWKFKHIPTLLIFGEKEESSEAYEAIKTLLKLSYPNKKILFYRGGIENWKRLGLTLY